MLDKLLKRNSLAVTVASFFLMGSIYGCASNLDLKTTSRSLESEAAHSTKAIDLISTKDTVKALDVMIRGNHELIYTAVKQTTPLGVILYFPGTALRVDKSTVAVDNEVINNISAKELIKDGPSKILISLKEDLPYQINQRDNQLVVSFQKQTTVGQQAPKLPVKPDEKPPANASETIALESDLPSPAEAAISETELDSSADSPAAKKVTDKKLTEDTPIATRFDSVEATNHADGVDIHLITDGAIKNYKQFTIENPARIVFDIEGIKSPYKGQQVVTLADNKWVKRVRHYTHPDKVRVVLDTDPKYLSEFTVKPVESGLVVQVGKTEEAAANEKADITTDEVLADAVDEKEPPHSQEKVDDHQLQAKDVPVAFQMEAYEPNADAKPAPTMDQHNSDDVIAESTPHQEDTLVAQAETQSESNASTEAMEQSGGVQPPPGDTLAVVNQIDFSSGDNGKSTIIIGTTEAVKYSLDQVKDNTLILKLMDTKIPGFRQRPLITTRFESAVDLITPVHTPAMVNDSAIEIVLRESVPHMVEQKGNQILIRFEASSIPPKAVDESKLASLNENVLDQSGSLATEAQEKVAPTVAAEVSQPEQVESMQAVESGANTVTKTESGTTEAKPEIQPAETETHPMEAAAQQAAPAEMDPSLRIPTPEEPEENNTAMERSFGFYDTNPKRYTGEKIVLDFYETDIKNVLRILRDISGKNFAIDNNVKGKVTLSFIKPVPWDQVLDLILKMNGLGRTYEGNIIRIATLSTLRKEDEARKAKISAEHELRDEKIAMEPLVTEYIPISYSNAAADIKPRLMQIKTPERGQIGVDKRTNQIIMTDVAAKIKQAKQIVKKLDKITPQVIIEARIVEANTAFSRELGTQWSAAGGPNNRTELGGSYDYSVAMNTPSNAQNTLIGFNFSRITGSPFSLNAQLMAMESNGQGKIISMPKVATLDNEKATIKSGVEYPYNKRDADLNTITEYKDIAVSLEVTPSVTPDNRISLKIKVEKNDLGEVINDEQSFLVKEAETKLLVNDGDTVVIGGVLKNNVSSSSSGVPWLSKIPGLGAAFRSHIQSDRKEELLIFITPKIVRLEEKGLL